MIVSHARWLSKIGGHVDGALRSVRRHLDRAGGALGPSNWSFTGAVLSGLKMACITWPLRHRLQLDIPVGEELGIDGYQ
jgi:hypothetical protein